MASSNESDPPEDMEGVRLWIARHGTESTSRWEQQWRENAEMKKGLSETKEQVFLLRMRFVWVAGLIFGATLVGNFLTTMLAKKLIGV